MTDEEKKELKIIIKFIRSMGLLKEANLLDKLLKDYISKDKIKTDLEGCKKVIEEYLRYGYDETSTRIACYQAQLKAYERLLKE